jgi:hypothetical protein
VPLLPLWRLCSLLLIKAAALTSLSSSSPPPPLPPLPPPPSPLRALVAVLPLVEELAVVSAPNTRATRESKPVTGSIQATSIEMLLSTVALLLRLALGTLGLNKQGRGRPSATAAAASRQQPCSHPPPPPGDDRNK